MPPLHNYEMIAIHWSSLLSQTSTEHSDLMQPQSTIFEYFCSGTVPRTALWLRQPEDLLRGLRSPLTWNQFAPSYLQYSLFNGLYVKSTTAGLLAGIKRA